MYAAELPEDIAKRQQLQELRENLHMAQQASRWSKTFWATFDLAPGYELCGGSGRNEGRSFRMLGVEFEV